MNVIGWIILVSLAANHLIGAWAALLNLRAMRPDLPQEFEGTFDPDAYAKSQEYTRAKTRLGLIAESGELLILLAFWFSSGFEVLDQFVRGFGLGETATGVAYIAILLGAQALVGLPVSIYATFVLEERFGFNRTTPATFVLDRLKGLLLFALIGAPVIAGILLFFNTAGSLAWLYCWIFVVAITIIMQYLAPTLIMPLFNKFEPLEEGELRQRILEMAGKAGFPVRNILVMDGSKRSGKSNAFFTGLGRQKRIALYDTLVEQHTTDELVAVLAHEIGHYKKKHILQGLAVAILHAGILLFLLSLVLTYQPLFDAFFVTQPSVYAALIFFGLLLSPIEFLLGLAMNALSRHNEYQADRFAAELTGGAHDMTSALKRLSRANLINLTPHPTFVRLNYSHPPVLERIQALRNL